MCCPVRLTTSQIIVLVQLSTLKLRSPTPAHITDTHRSMWEDVSAQRELARNLHRFLRYVTSAVKWYQRMIMFNKNGTLLLNAKHRAPVIQVLLSRVSLTLIRFKGHFTQYPILHAHPISYFTYFDAIWHMVLLLYKYYHVSVSFT
jgi:hypothetical protein